MSIALRLAALVGRFGRPAVLRRTIAGGGDPWAPELLQTDYPIRLLCFGQYHFGPQGEILAGEGHALVAAASLPLAPLPGDSLLLDGRSLAVIAVDTRGSGSRALIHRLKVSA